MRRGLLSGLIVGCGEFESPLKRLPHRARHPRRPSALPSSQRYRAPSLTGLPAFTAALYVGAAPPAMAAPNPAGRALWGSRFSGDGPPQANRAPFGTGRSVVVITTPSSV